MTRTRLVTLAIVAATLGAAPRGMQPPPARPDLSGAWTLNPKLSKMSTDVGFGMDLLSTAGAGSDAARGGGTEAAGMIAFRESEDDAKRRTLLVDAVRNPPARLTIADAQAAVTFVDDRGRVRTIHPDGKQEALSLGPVSVLTTSRWEAGQLDVHFKVAQNREVTYTYTRTVDPPRLTVNVRLVERGGKDALTFVYEPTKPEEMAAPAAPVAPWAAPPAVPAGAAGRPPGLGQPPAKPPGGGAALPPLEAPPVAAPRPGAAFKGLTTLGVVVADLSPQAAGCGLTRAPLEAAVSKALTDAGFTVDKGPDPDTFVSVQVVTTTMAPGLCVSRYDAFLYSRATVTLSYQQAPVRMQGELLHQGGLSVSSPGAHGESVIKSLRQQVEAFVTEIRSFKGSGLPDPEREGNR